MSRTDEVKWLLPYAPKYEAFGEADGRAFGAYGYRIAHNIHQCDMIDLVMRHLEAMPHSRQAVVSLWRPDDLYVATTSPKRDIPCTLSLQFLVRDDALNLIVNMRSNDVWLGMPYDVYVFTSIQKLVAMSLGLKPGIYRHNVGSMHLYDRNAVAAMEAFEQRGSVQCEGTLVTPSPLDNMITATKAAMSWKYMQQGSFCATCLKEYGPMLRSTIACAAKKFGHNIAVDCPVLKGMMN